jgi:hypothetical protein
MDERPKLSGLLDFAANREAQKWTLRELRGRALWEVLPLFAWTPRPLLGGRVVQRLFGASIVPSSEDFGIAAIEALLARIPCVLGEGSQWRRRSKRPAPGCPCHAPSAQ